MPNTGNLKTNNGLSQQMEEIGAEAKKSSAPARGQRIKADGSLGKKRGNVMRIIFVIGGTATGKSTFMKRHFLSNPVSFFDILTYQERTYDEFMSEWRKLYRANDELLDDILKFISKLKFDIVVEHTLFMAKRRIAYIDEIRKATDAEIEFYVMQPSDEQWESNIKARGLIGDLNTFKSELEIFEFPNPAEGIDAIYEVTDGDVVTLRMDAPKPEILEPARKELAEERDRILKSDEKRRLHEELIKSMRTRPFWHYCEVCGKKEFITAKEAYESGWDYPPNMGFFGIIGPRTCGNCAMADTLYMKFINSGLISITESALTPEELKTLVRIRNEPESLLDEEADFINIT